MNPLRIEQVAGAEKLRALSVLEAVCFPGDAWSEEALDAFLAASIRKAFLLLEEEQAIGYIILTVFDGEAEIERLGIAPEQRGAHKGRRMLTAVLDLLAAERCLLEVNAHNLAAVKLYEACGFETFSKRTAYYHDGADALMMEWKRKNE